MDSRVIRVKTLNTVFDQFIRDDLEHAQGEWTLERVKILTNMLKMKLESRSEDLEQSMVVSSNQEEKADEAVLDEIKLPDLKASNPSDTIASLSRLAIAINKLNKYVTSLKEIASNSPKKGDKPPQNITVNIVPQTPLKNQPIQTLPSLTPRRRTPFKDTNGQEVEDQFMQELFNHPTVSGFLDHLTLDLIGDLMHDDGSSSHASTPIDPTDSSEMDATLTAAINASGGSLTTPKEIFRKPPIERMTPSAKVTSDGNNPVKNLMHELRTPEKGGRGNDIMSSPFSSPFVPCSSPCPEPVNESPFKIVIPDFNALTASPIQTPAMLSATPRPVFIVQQSHPTHSNHQQKSNVKHQVNQLQQRQQQVQPQFVNSGFVTTQQVVSLGRKIAPKLPGTSSQTTSGIKMISPLKSRPGRKSQKVTKKVDPSEIEKAIKETQVSSKNSQLVNVQKRKTSSTGSSGSALKRFVKLNPGTTTGTHSSPESHRLVIDEGKIVQQMSVQSTTIQQSDHSKSTTSAPVSRSNTGHTTILSSSLINLSSAKSNNDNELCNNETMDVLKGLPKNSRKLDELLLSKVHNSSKK